MVIIFINSVFFYIYIYITYRWSYQVILKIIKLFIVILVVPGKKRLPLCLCPEGLCPLQGLLIEFVVLFPGAGPPLVLPVVYVHLPNTRIKITENTIHSFLTRKRADQHKCLPNLAYINPTPLLLKNCN